MYSTKDVNIVIPNWNGRELLRRYLALVIKHSGSAEIIVVDDASSDGSVIFLKNQFPRITVLEKKTHGGFAGSVNAGVSISNRKIVVLLNTDVVPKKDYLKYILPHFSDDRVFAVGCLEESMENEVTVLRGRGTARWARGFFIHERGEVDRPTTAWVSGGSGAFRKSVWDKLGGMDQMFNPFYWEDIDLSYRALKAGYKLIFEPKSIVGHFHEKGAIRSTFSQNYVRQIAYRNQFIFIWKNCTDPGIFISHFIWNGINIMKSLVRFDWDYLIGLYNALAFIPEIIQKRRKYAGLWNHSDTEVSLQ